MRIRFRGASAVAAGILALGASLALALPASASIIGDPGVYLNSSDHLTMAAPNAALTSTDVTGRPAVLKTCLGNGDCSVLANDKATETFDFVASTNSLFPSYSEIRLHGTGWCVTNRGSSVTFEACHQYASQLFYGSSGTLEGVISNAKTDENLTHTGLAAYQPLQAGGSETRWGNSS